MSNQQPETTAAKHNSRLPDIEHDHKNGHVHKHGHSDISGRKIFFVTMLNAVITIAEFIGGLVSGSLALLSDSLHNLSDTVAVAMSYFAHRIAQRPKNSRLSYGYKRIEILTALVNSIALLGIAVFLIFEAVSRWRSPETINSTLMLVVAFIGLVANLLGVFLLERDSHRSLNIKSSYLHLLSDTISSVGVLLGGLAIRFWNVVWVDPLITMLIAVYIIIQTGRMLRDIVSILMQTAANLDYDKLRRDILAIDHVRGLHHIHTWMINEETIFFEAHVQMEDMPLAEVQTITEKIEELLKAEYGVSHVTLQAEVLTCACEEVCDA